MCGLLEADYDDYFATRTPLAVENVGLRNAEWNNIFSFAGITEFD